MLDGKLEGSIYQSLEIDVRLGLCAQSVRCLHGAGMVLGLEAEKDSSVQGHYKERGDSLLCFLLMKCLWP